MNVLKEYIFKYKKTAVAVLVLLVIIIVILTMGVFGYYPIAITNGKLISAHNFYKSYEVSRNYYSYFNSHSKDPVLQESLDKSLKKAAFEGAIDSVLIDERLKSEMKASELNVKINDQINELFKDQQFKKQLLETVLKASEDDAVKYFLNNTIRAQILDGRLRLESTNLIEWLYKQRENAHITILIPGYKWTGVGIDIK